MSLPVNMMNRVLLRYLLYCVINAKQMEMVCWLQPQIMFCCCACQLLPNIALILLVVGNGLDSFQVTQWREAGQDGAACTSFDDPCSVNVLKLLQIAQWREAG